MKFNIRINDANYKEKIHFLNSDAKLFYQSHYQFADRNYEINFKSALLSAIIDIEKVIRGTFNCDIFLKNVNLELIKKMFPNAINNIFNVQNEEDIKKLGHLLEILRNMHSHAFICKDDLDFFKYDYSVLNNQQKMNKNIKYYDNGITIAGVIFIVLNFLRDNSIRNLTLRDTIFGLVSCGNMIKDDGVNFVNKISKVNLDLDIRRNIGTDILTSIIGELKDNVSYENSCFHIRIGAKNYPTFIVTGSYVNNLLTIKSNSLTRVYYEEDYSLQIVEQKGFIELSNGLPPFVFVDYLKQADVHVFDNVAYNKAKKFSILKKLNHPKFYVDKNVETIFLPDTISDFRLMSSVFSSSLVNVFLSLENYIYRTKKIETNDGYSSIGIAMTKIGVPKDIITDAKYVRNFAAHGYMLNEFLIYKSCRKQYTLDYIIYTLKLLLDYFENNEPNIYTFLSICINKCFISKAKRAKYKKILETSKEAFDTFPNFDKQLVAKKNEYVNHSSFELEKLNVLVNQVSENYIEKVICIKFSDYVDPLYLDSDKEDFVSIFALKNHYAITEVIDHGLIKYYKLIKNNI